MHRNKVYRTSPNQITGIDCQEYGLEIFACASYQQDRWPSSFLNVQIVGVYRLRILKVSVL